MLWAMSGFCIDSIRFDTLFIPLFQRMGTNIQSTQTTGHFMVLEHSKTVD